MAQVYEDELEHFGIKGQKWGFRRYQNPDGTLTAAGKLHYAKREAKQARKEAKARYKFEKAEEKRKQDPKRLTDDELRDRLVRLRMESEYQRLYSELNPKKVHNGRQLVGRILSNGAEILGKKAFESLASKIFDKKDQDDSAVSARILTDPDNSKWTNQELATAASRAKNIRSIKGQDNSKDKKNKAKHEDDSKAYIAALDYFGLKHSEEEPEYQAALSYFGLDVTE